MKYDPKQVMVLGAIQSGANKFNKIRKVTGVKPEELDSILEELERMQLIAVVEKKGFLGKKVEIHSTEKGRIELENSVNEMESKWGEMKTLYQLQDKKKLQSFMDDNRSFLPMMMFFGVIDIMMFSMMFSMMGASMSSYVPAESMPPGAEDASQADAGGADGGYDGGQDYSDPGIGDFDLGF